jgi:GTP cyclohydrolase IA
MSLNKVAPLNGNGRHAMDEPVARNIDYDRVLKLGQELLEALGEDPNREGLLETPRRWASWWKEFIDYDPGVIDTTFESMKSGQLVVVSGIRVYSICEHHLLPFWCDVTVGYLVNEKLIGLSKIARIAHNVAHRLQLQEKIAEQIADEVERLADSDHVAVFCTGVHMCMVMRGIRTEGKMSSLAARGVFETDAVRRAEFMNLVDR